MQIPEIVEKLESAGCLVKTTGNRVYVKKTPNGKTGDYGFLIAGDNGSTGSCQNITKRKGEISEILRS